MPPKLAQRFLYWFLRDDLAEEVEGDLEEQFYVKLKEGSPLKAKLNYWYQVIGYLRPFAIRKSKQVHLNQYVMLLSYFKISWRNLRKHKFYSFISIFGLALGMSCSYLIWLWVQNETGYNDHFKNSEDIYYVHLNTIYEGQVYTNSVTPVPLHEALKKDIPEVANAVILSWNYDYLINNSEKLIKQTGIYASEDFFNMFDFQIVEGDPEKAIKSNQLVITKNTASKLFGSQSALDKLLIINEEKEYRVGAVIANIPDNASIQFDWVLNFRAIEQDWMQNWGNNGVKTYVHIHPNANKKTAESNMKEIYSRYTDIKNTFPILQPLKDVYLYSKFENGKPAGGRILYVHIFMAVAFFILLIACINYLNLSTAYSTNRAKEVGLRKVVGASKGAIVQQFISESILFTLIALVIAIVIIHLSLPTINNLLGTQIQLDFSDPTIALGIFFLLIITGILSGSYPAFYVSSLQPSRILNKHSKNTISTNFIRKTLVIFQFSISVFLLIGIVVISKQLHYANSIQT
ncbi:MAG: ABC transporter permease, partial [Bacteroidota bacterium]